MPTFNFGGEYGETVYFSIEVLYVKQTDIFLRPLQRKISKDNYGIFEIFVVAITEYQDSV